MKHFIYKTIHKNGKYYIGRHSTDNIDDGYIGSGKWPLSIKDRNDLSREIIEFTDTVEQLIEAENRYLKEHFGKEGCMNHVMSAVGFDASENNPSKIRSRKGKHQWQDGKSPNAHGKLNKQLVNEGKHNFLGPKVNHKRISEGTHNFLGADLNKSRLAAGTHPSQKIMTCTCGKTVSVGMFKRWHGENCKGVK